MAIPQFYEILRDPEFKNADVARQKEINDNYWKLYEKENPGDSWAKEQATDARSALTAKGELESAAPITRRALELQRDAANVRIGLRNEDRAGGWESPEQRNEFLKTKQAEIDTRRESVQKTLSLFTKDVDEKMQPTWDALTKTAASSGYFEGRQALRGPDGELLVGDRTDAQRAQYLKVRDTMAEDFNLTPEEVDDLVKHRMGAQKDAVSRDAVGGLHIKDELLVRGNDEVQRAIIESSLPDKVKSDLSIEAPQRLALFKTGVVENVKKQHPELAAEIKWTGDVQKDYAKLTQTLNDSRTEQFGGGLAATLSGRAETLSRGSVNAMNQELEAARAISPQLREVFPQPDLEAGMAPLEARTKRLESVNQLSEFINQEKVRILGVDAATVAAGVYSGVESIAIGAVTGGLGTAAISADRIKKAGTVGKILLGGAQRGLNTAPIASIYGMEQGIETYERTGDVGLSLMSAAIEGGVTTFFGAIKLGGTEDLGQRLANPAVRTALGKSVGKAWRDFGVDVGKTVTGEQLEELTITTLNNLYVESKLNPGMTVADMKKSLWDTAVSTFFASGPMGAITGAREQGGNLFRSTIELSDEQVHEESDARYKAAAQENIPAGVPEGGTKQAPSNAGVAPVAKMTRAELVEAIDEERAATEDPERLAELEGTPEEVAAKLGVEITEDEQDNQEEATPTQVPVSEVPTEPEIEEDAVAPVSTPETATPAEAEAGGEVEIPQGTTAQIAKAKELIGKDELTRRAELWEEANAPGDKKMEVGLEAAAYRTVAGTWEEVESKLQARIDSRQQPSPTPKVEPTVPPATEGKGAAQAPSLLNAPIEDIARAAVENPSAENAALLVFAAAGTRPASLPGQEAKPEPKVDSKGNLMLFQGVERTAGTVPSTLSKDQRNTVARNIQKTQMSPREVVDALARLSPSDVMAITEKLDDASLRRLTGGADNRRLTMLSDLRRNVNGRRAALPSSTQASPMQDEQIRKPVDRVAARVIGMGTLEQLPETHTPIPEAEIPTRQEPASDLSYKTLRENVKAFNKMVSRLISHHVFRIGNTEGLPTEEIADRILKQMVNNILFVYDNVPEVIRTESKKWYKGANRIARMWSQKYGVSTQAVAGVIAALSPQKDWFQNVSLAERVLDIWTGDNRVTNVFGSEMEAAADKMDQAQAAEAKGKKYIEIEGVRTELFEHAQRLKELMGRDFDSLGVLDKAFFIRLYDETYNSRSYSLITPDGRFGKEHINKDGSPTKIAWGTVHMTASAVAMLEDPSVDNISRQLGHAHKIRSFYNNIINPDSDQTVTSDTHAVAVAYMMPLSGAAREVTDNFGGITTDGYRGTYAFITEAYRRAAKKRGIKPSEMQSVTWESIRDIFPAAFKRNKGKVDQIREAWDNFSRNRTKEPYEKVRQRAYEAGGGYAFPQWYQQPEFGFGDSGTAWDRTTTYIGKDRGDQPDGLPAGSGRGDGRSRKGTGAKPETGRAAGGEQGTLFQDGEVGVDERFTELTRDLPEKPTVADLDAWRASHPDEYRELKEMRERVLREAGYDIKAAHGGVAGIDTFDAEKIKQQEAAMGFFFALGNNIGQAAGYANRLTGGKLYEVLLKMRNPYYAKSAYPSNPANDPEVWKTTLQSIKDIYGLTDSDMQIFRDGVEAYPFNILGNAGEFKYRLYLFMDSEGFSKLSPKAQSGITTMNKTLRGEFGAQKALDLIWLLTKHDGVIFRDGEVASVLRAENIKSTEPLSLDATGRLIPPSQWGDTGSPSILFQEPSQPKGTYTPKAVAKAAGVAKATLGLLEGKSDASTGIHEAGHAVEDFLEEIGEGDKAEALRTWAKENGKTEWREQREFIARGFERFVVNGVKTGVEAVDRAFARIAEIMLNIYKGIKGSSIDIDIPPHIEKIFNDLLSRGAELEAAGKKPLTLPVDVVKAPAKAPAKPKKPARKLPRAPSTTSVKNAETDKELVAAGFSAIYEPAKVALQESWDQALAEVRKDPTVGKVLVEELHQKPRVISDVEHGILIDELAKSKLRYKNAEKAFFEATKEGNKAKQSFARAEIEQARVDINRVAMAAKLAGTEWGRAGRFRQIRIEEDYSIEAMTSRYQAVINDGQPLDKEGRQEKDIRRMQKQIEDSEAARVKAEEEMLEAIRKLEVAELEIQNLKAIREERKKPAVPRRTMTERAVSMKQSALDKLAALGYGRRVLEQRGKPAKRRKFYSKIRSDEKIYTEGPGFNPAAKGFRFYSEKSKDISLSTGEFTVLPPHHDFDLNKPRQDVLVRLEDGSEYRVALSDTKGSRRIENGEYTHSTAELWTKGHMTGGAYNQILETKFRRDQYRSRGRGQSVRKALELVPSTHPLKPLARQLAKFKSSLLDSDTLKPIGYNSDKDSDSTSTRAFRSFSGYIGAGSEGMSVDTLIHETIHTLTADALHKYVPSFSKYTAREVIDVVVDNEQTPDAIRNLIYAYESTLDQLGLTEKYLGAGEKKGIASGDPDETTKAGGDYSLANLDEFIAQAFSSEEFQNTLKGLRGLEGKSVWQNVVDVIRSLLGISKDVPNSMLESVINAALDVAALEIKVSGVTGEISNTSPSILRQSPELEPEALAAFADYVAALRIENKTDKQIEEELAETFGGQLIEDHSDAIFAAAGETLKKVAASSRKKTPQELASLIDPEKEELPQRMIFNMVVGFLRQGLRGDAVLDAVTELIQTKLPDVTRTQVSDAYTSYGKAKFPSKDELLTMSRELRRIELIKRQIDVVRQGMTPEKTGQQRDTATAEIRDLMKELNEAKRAAKLTHSHKDTQTKGYLDALETRLRHDIEDIDRAIAKNERIDRKKRTPEYDQTISDLKAEKAAAQQRYDDHFGVNRKQLTDEQRIAATLRILDRQIAEEEQMERDGVLNRPKAVSKTPQTPEITARRARLQELRALRRAAREAANPAKTEAQRATDRLRNSVQKSIERFEYFLANGRFPAKPDGTTYSREDFPSELIQLRDDLREAVDSLRADEKPRTSADERRLKATISTLENAVKDLQRRIDTKDFSKPERIALNDPRVTGLRETVKIMRSVLNDMSRVGEIVMTPEEKQEASLIKAAQTRTAKIRARIAAGDFSKTVKPPRVQTAALRDAMHKEALAKQEWNRIFFEQELKNRSVPQKVWDSATDVVNMSRTFMTMADVSGVLRQGGLGVLAHPLMGLRGITPMFKAGFSEAEALAQYNAALESPNGAIAQEAKLFLAKIGPDVKLSEMEEAFRGRLAKKIPGFKSIAGFSERTYAAFLNKLRLDMFNAMVAGLSADGRNVSLAEAKEIARYINIATGRGDLGKMESAAAGLATAFFSPKFVVSRFQWLWGLFPATFNIATGFQFTPKDVRRAKKAIAKEYSRTLVGMAAVYTLAMMAKAAFGDDDEEEMVFDPRSSKFLKINLGNTKIDPMSGLLQAATFASRMLPTYKKGEGLGFYTEDRDGDIVSLTGVGFGRTGYAGVIGRFLRSKASPLVGTWVNVGNGFDMGYNKVNWKSEMIGAFTPLVVGDIFDTMREQGVAKGLPLAMLAMLGMGIQNHNDELPAEQRFLLWTGLANPEEFSKGGKAKSGEPMKLKLNLDLDLDLKL